VEQTVVQPAESTEAEGTAALAHACGLPLGSFRPEHLERQIRRALAAEGLASRRELAVRVLARPELRTRVRRAIAVSVSAPFRDPEQFELLEREIVPPLVEAPGAVRVWSAGCADGSELLSLAVLMQRQSALERAHLLGSDLLEENVRAARAAGATLPEAVRRRLRWERRDLTTQSPPPGSWRLILCRNLAIYLRPEEREGLLERLSAALSPGGALMLGRSERISDPGSIGLEEIGPHCYRRPA
jgi:chemotaxis protein methyltransferase CheR